MTKRMKKRSVKARNPIAKDLRDPKFHLRLKPSKKLYQRKSKHRGRFQDTDLGSGFEGGLRGALGAMSGITTCSEEPTFSYPVPATR